MIFTEKKITITNDECKIDSPVVLYRGDYNVEVRFTIVSCPYKYSKQNESNVIETTDASYGQLVINVPNSKPIFSDVAPVESDGAIIFTIKKEMIDETIELGEYDFQIRLFDENQQSRATIPPVIQGIKIKEPIAVENDINVAQVNYGSTSTSTPLDSFDSDGNYIETSWKDRDLITDSKLNKIEKALTGINNKTKDIEGSIPTKTSQLTNDSGYVTDTEMMTAIENKDNIQNARLDAIEAVDVAQNSRLDAIEVKNQQQDDRLLDIEKANKRQDNDLKCLFAASKNNMIDVTEEGNSVYLQNSTIGYTSIDEIKGNTLVNCNKEPDKELILNGNINTSADNTVTITEGVDGGLVDVALEGNTLVNVSKTKDITALPLEEDLTYLYASTQYTVQFVSDKATTADITLGGTSLLAQSIVAGLNRISITTPETLVNNKLVINGAGAKIRDIVVTDTDREFSYFEGMKSVGECEGNKIEILSRYHYIDYNSHMNQGHNAKPIWSFSTGLISDYLQYFNEVSNYISCEKLFDYYYIEGNASLWINLGSFDPYEAFEILNIRIAEGEGKINKKEMTHEPLRAVGDTKDRYVLIDGKWYIERNCQQIAFTKNIDYWIESENDTFVTFQCTPTFFTNIKECSFAGKNIIIDKKVSGLTITTQTIWIKFNKDVVSNVESLKNYLPMNLVIPVATPTYEEINYNPLEVYSGTTHITTNSTIPTNITVKNHGFSCLLKPSTTYTISSNLGLNTVTTPSKLTEDCLRFMDTDTSDVTTMRDVLILEGDWTTKSDLIPANFSGIESAFEQEYDAEKGKYKVNVKVANEDKTKENNITFYINEPLRGIGDVKDRVFIKDDKVVVERNCGIRAYEDGDFGVHLTDKVNTVYTLAEPVYEEVEYNDTKLFIESFKNSTLFYNSNVPVTSKLYYSYSVPIVDKVAQTANVTDQQDSMIIDLATQCAVMEMMLM